VGAYGVGDLVGGEALDASVVDGALVGRVVRLLVLEEDRAPAAYGWPGSSSTPIPAEMIHYGMSKTALLGISRGFAKEAAGSGVTVNSVIAGPTHTGGVEDFVYELVDSALPWDEAQRAFMREHRPQSLIQRLIEPEEIANMVVYLSSPLASATTGGALRVDGGYVDSILP
jgi:NAD(P)-dependent dehydrogenase (short-subunit alcohol dehydrogenase family)